MTGSWGVYSRKLLWRSSGVVTRLSIAAALGLSGVAVLTTPAAADGEVTAGPIVFASPAVYTGTSGVYTASVTWPSTFTVPSVSDGIIGDTFYFSIASSGNTAHCGIHSDGTHFTYTHIGSCVVDVKSSDDPDRDNDNDGSRSTGTLTVTVNKASQTITTPSAPSGPWSGSLSVATTATSGLAVTYAIGGGSAAGCSVDSSGSVTASGSGTCVVDLNQAGNGDWSAAAQVQVTATFGPVSQTIHFAESGQGSWATTRSTVSGLTKSGTGTVSYFIDAGTNGHTSPSGCAVDPLSGAVSASGAVTCYVYAVIAPDLNYLGATSSDVAVSFTLASQVIYAVPASGMVGTPVVLHATGYTGTGAISFALAGGGTATGCSISSGQMSATSGGTCRFVAMIAPDGNYSGATSTPADITLAAPGNLIVGASSQTMNVGGVVAIAASVTGLLGGDSATVSSVTLTYTGTGGTTYGPSTTAPTAPGTYSVMPSAASVVVTPGADQSLYSTTYAYTPGTLVIVATAQVTVTVSDVAITAGDAVNPVVSVSGLAAGDSATLTSVTLTYTGTGGTTYGPTTVAPTAAGTYLITPSAATVAITPSGDQGNYSATIVYVSGTLVVAPAPVVVVNNPPPAPPTTFTIKSFGEGSFKLTAKLKKQVRALALKVRAGHYKVVTLTGFTDNVFTASLNVVLTQNRAAVVASELQKDLKVLKVGGVTIRIVPGVTITLVTSNTTPQGRAENRRVVATLQAK